MADLTETKSNLESIASMLETLDRQGDAFVKLSPDMRRLLVQATILARREAER